MESGLIILALHGGNLLKISHQIYKTDFLRKLSQYVVILNHTKDHIGHQFWLNII